MHARQTSYYDLFRIHYRIYLLLLNIIIYGTSCVKLENGTREVLRKSDKFDSRIYISPNGPHHHRRGQGRSSTLFCMHTKIL